MSNADAVKNLFNEWAREGKDIDMEDGHKHAVREALREVSVPQEASILDVGCGNGYVVRALAKRLPDASVMGIDISDEMIFQARDLTHDDVFNAGFFEGSIFDENLNEDRFDLIFGMESIYYISPVKDAIKRLASLLNPGGQLLLVVDLYQENEASHGWAEKYGVEMELLSAQDYVDAMAEAGLEDPFQRYITYPEGSTSEEWKVTKGSLMTSAFKPFSAADEEGESGDEDSSDDTGANESSSDDDGELKLPENPLDIFN